MPNLEDRRVEVSGWLWSVKNYEERAFVTDLRPRKQKRTKVEPRVSIRIAYRLERLV